MYNYSLRDMEADYMWREWQAKLNPPKLPDKNTEEYKAAEAWAKKAAAECIAKFESDLCSGHDLASLLPYPVTKKPPC